MTLSSAKLSRVADRGGASFFRTIDLSMHPGDPRGSFPGLPTFRLLRNPAEVLNTLLDKAPSSLVTGYIGFGFGVVWAVLIRVASIAWRRLFLRQRQRRFVSLALVSLCAAFSGALLVVLHRILRRRLITVKQGISAVTDVSSSSLGPCRVMCSAISVTNSHAGTHADTPFHFCRSTDSVALQWDPLHYNGPVVVLDVSPHIIAAGSRAITRDMLIAAGSDAGVVWESVWRLVLRTKEVSGSAAAGWTYDFAHFDISAAQFLAELPNLLLVALDTPSVDHVTRSPICDGAHGVFFESRIAVMENLVIPPELFSVNSTTDDNRKCSAIRGTLLTCFHPTQEFEDSRGCTPLLLLDA